MRVRIIAGMKRALASCLILLCVANFAFAASKKKKKAPPPAEKEPEILFDDSCYSNAISWQRLLTTNPYDTEGKCYMIDFALVKQQLLSRNVALVGFPSQQQNIFALMIFPEESVPMGAIYGLVMGAGAYQYETVGGAVNTVHRFVKMKEYLKDKRKTQPATKEEPAKDQTAESTNTPKGE